MITTWVEEGDKYAPLHSHSQQQQQQPLSGAAHAFSAEHDLWFIHGGRPVPTSSSNHHKHQKASTSTHGASSGLWVLHAPSGAWFDLSHRPHHVLALPGEKSRDGARLERLAMGGIGAADVAALAMRALGMTNTAKHQRSLHGNSLRRDDVRGAVQALVGLGILERPPTRAPAAGPHSTMARHGVKRERSPSAERERDASDGEEEAPLPPSSLLLKPEGGSRVVPTDAALAAQTGALVHVPGLGPVPVAGASSMRGLFVGGAGSMAASTAPVLHDHVGLVYGGSTFIVHGGRRPSSSSSSREETSSDLYAFCPRLGQWERLTPIIGGCPPPAMHGHACFHVREEESAKEAEAETMEQGDEKEKEDVVESSDLPETTGRTDQRAEAKKAVVLGPRIVPGSSSAASAVFCFVGPLDDDSIDRHTGHVNISRKPKPGRGRGPHEGHMAVYALVLGDYKRWVRISGASPSGRCPTTTSAPTTHTHLPTLPFPRRRHFSVGQRYQRIASANTVVVAGRAGSPLAGSGGGGDDLCMDFFLVGGVFDGQALQDVHCYHAALDAWQPIITSGPSRVLVPAGVGLPPAPTAIISTSRRIKQQDECPLGSTGQGNVNGTPLTASNSSGTSQPLKPPPPLLSHPPPPRHTLVDAAPLALLALVSATTSSRRRVSSSSSLFSTAHAASQPMVVAHRRRRSGAGPNRNSEGGSAAGRQSSWSDVLLLANGHETVYVEWAVGGCENTIIRRCKADTTRSGAECRAGVTRARDVYFTTAGPRGCDAASNPIPMPSSLAHTESTTTVEGGSGGGDDSGGGSGGAASQRFIPRAVPHAAVPLLVELLSPPASSNSSSNSSASDTADANSLIPPNGDDNGDNEGDMASLLLLGLALGAVGSGAPRRGRAVQPPTH